MVGNVQKFGIISVGFFCLFGSSALACTAIPNANPNRPVAKCVVNEENADGTLYAKDPAKFCKDMGYNNGVVSFRNSPDNKEPIWAVCQSAK